MTSPAPSPIVGIERLRRRTVWTLVAGVGLGSTGHIAAVTVATIAADELGGSEVWSGAPGAAVVLGAAIGSVLLSNLMVRSGRRAGLSAGYAIGVVGALLGTAAIVGGSLSLLIVGTVLIGFGNSSNQLSRYTAADLYPPDRRASAIGIVVWGATIGAVVGPNLVAPAGVAAEALGLPDIAGAYLLPVLFVGLAALLSFAMLRPDPYQLADISSVEDQAVGDGSLRVSLASVLRRPHVPVAMVALVTGQFVMVLIMTMTPLHMAQHGHDLASVGLVISAHTFGMFGLSPISGRLTDRYGSVPVILAGLGTVAISAVMAAAAPPDGGAVLLLALFLLGYGWNLGFVAGSALLTTGLSLAERTRLQGATDALIWGSAAIASLGSGFVLALASYTVLGLLGAALVIVPVMLVLARRSIVESFVQSSGS
jgi:MFS family permease